MEGNHPYIDMTKFINEQSPKCVGECWQGDRRGLSLFDA